MQSVFLLVGTIQILPFLFEDPLGWGEILLPGIFIWRDYIMDRSKVATRKEKGYVMEFVECLVKGCFSI